MINLTTKELKNLIEEKGLFKASAYLKCGYITLKKVCDENGIKVQKRGVGRPRSFKVVEGVNDKR